MQTLLAAVCLLMTLTLQAQQIHRCYTMEHQAEILRHTPKSAYMNNFDYSGGNGKFDDFTLPVVNMSGGAFAYFDVANTYYSVEGTDCGTAQTGVCSYDTLVVLVSNNCGATFSEVYRKQKDLLKTAPSQQTAFYPTTVAQ